MNNDELSQRLARMVSHFISNENTTAANAEQLSNSIEEAFKDTLNKEVYMDALIASFIERVLEAFFDGDVS